MFKTPSKAQFTSENAEEKVRNVLARLDQVYILSEAEKAEYISLTEELQTLKALAAFTPTERIWKCDGSVVELSHGEIQDKIISATTKQRLIFRKFYDNSSRLSPNELVEEFRRQLGENNANTNRT